MNSERNEGMLLKNYLKGAGYNLSEIAIELGFEGRSGLNYHLGKAKLDSDFITRVQQYLKSKGVQDVDVVKVVRGKKDSATEVVSIGEAEPTRSGNVFFQNTDGSYVMVIPMVTQFAYGGYLKGFSDPEYISELPTHSMIVPIKHRGIYRTFVMLGDSMDDGSKGSIEDGDKVTGRLIDKQYWTSKLHIHKYKEFIIHHEDGVIVKEIIEHNVDRGFIVVHSRNPDKEEYPDRKIYLSACIEIYNVIEVSKPRK